MTACLRTLAPVVAYVAVVAAMAVGADRVVSEWLIPNPSRYAPTYRSYYHPSVGFKIKQVEDLASLDTLIIGNSVTMLAVDPEAMQEQSATLGTPLDAYSLAFPSVAVAFWPRFLSQE
jgi:hypothetical protein